MMLVVWWNFHLYLGCGVVVYRVSLKERVEYADEMMENIMDSADHPMEVGIYLPCLSGL